MVAKSRTRVGQGDETRSAREFSADADRRGDGLLSEDELRNLVRSEFVQESLPQFQAPPGWHYCWLAINSQHDPVHKRMRVGYQPVQFAELAEQGHGAGFESYKAPNGEFAGAVSCNEMVLFKITQTRYQIIMAEFHHHMPLAEEQSIKAKAVASQTDSKGRKLVEIDSEDDGINGLGVEPEQTPTFA